MSSDLHFYDLQRGKRWEVNLSAFYLFARSQSWPQAGGWHWKKKKGTTSGGERHKGQGRRDEVHFTLPPLHLHLDANSNTARRPTKDPEQLNDGRVDEVVWTNFKMHECTQLSSPVSVCAFVPGRIL